MDFINRDILLNVLYKATNNKNVKLLDWTTSKNIVVSAYTSDNTTLIVKYEDENGKQEKYFFAKFPNISTSKIMNLFRVYEKEKYIYAELIPRFEKLIDFRLTPLCYYSDQAFNIILENLQAEGYSSHKEYGTTDFRSTCKVMETLAVLHALSYKLKLMSPELFDNEILKQNLYKMFVLKEKYHRICKTAIPKILQRVDPLFFDKYADKLEKFSENMLKSVVNEIKPKKNSFVVLAHGDFRLANTMFKYDKYGNLVDIKIIDHQTSLLSDPSVDIMNYIIQSIEFETFEKYFGSFLEIYTNTLNQYLKYFECDRTYSIGELQNDVENKYNLIIYQLISIVPFSMSKLDNLNKNLLMGDELIYEGAHYKKLSEKWFRYFIKKSLSGANFEIFVPNLE
ncbi:hypothetical protein PGB90_001723 [Kerria lacca]